MFCLNEKKENVTPGANNMLQGSHFMGLSKVKLTVGNQTSSPSVTRAILISTVIFNAHHFPISLHCPLSLDFKPLYYL